MFNKYVSRSHQLAFHAVIDSPVKAETAKVLSSNDVLFHLIRTPKYNKGEEQKKTKKAVNSQRGKTGNNQLFGILLFLTSCRFIFGLFRHRRSNFQARRRRGGGGIKVIKRQIGIYDVLRQH